MGKPVWMMSRFDGCFRWLEDRADTPWYPTMRIFRQGADRSWEPVVASIAAALAESWMTPQHNGPVRLAPTVAREKISA
jgi:hypothetical protein